MKQGKDILGQQNILIIITDTSLNIRWEKVVTIKVK